MKRNGDLAALEKFLRPLSNSLTTELARALVELAADEETQARYDFLAERKNQGCITPPEDEELELLVRANTLLGLLKAEARLILSHIKPA